MSYPIKARDLEKNQASNDEEALYIAVEAILNGEFENLAFAKNVNVVELKQAVSNDPKFEEVRGIIGYEQNLLTSVIANNEAQNDIKKLMEIQSKTLAEFDANNQVSKHSNFAKLSVAASLLVVVMVSVLSFSYIANKDSTAKKSNSQSVQYDKSVENKGPNLESGSSTDTNPGVVTRDDTEPTATTEIPETSSVDSTAKVPEATTDSESGGFADVSANSESIDGGQPFIEKNKNIIIDLIIFVLILLIILLFRFAFKKRDSKNN